MQSGTSKFTRLTPWLFLLCIFLLLTAPYLFTPGMFLDGVTYAAIARNFAFDGELATHLTYTQTLFPQFVEHPPIHFWLSGMLYKLFGDHEWVENLYCLITAAFTAFFIAKIWQVLLPAQRNHFWLPVLLWLLIPAVNWSYSNNMLENTLSIFVLAATFAYLKFVKSKKITWLFLAGFFLAAAFFTKGFVALYIWVLPALYAWFMADIFSFKKAVTHSVLFVAATAIPALLYLWLVPDAALMTELYIQKQVVGSIQHVVTVSSRFFILGDFILKILIPLIVVAVFYFLAKRTKSGSTFAKNHANLGWALLLVALSGVLPVMISLKQRSFYIVSVYPFVALAISAVAFPFFEFITVWFQTKKAFYTTLAINIVAVALISLLVNFGGGRDHEMMRDVAAIRHITGDGALLQCTATMRLEESGTHAYLQRYGRLSMGPNVDSDYFLVKTGTQRGDSLLYQGEMLSLYYIENHALVK
jgi:4-amino-4-deoxy-L-arabinose transferase-like glycosyltransferase